MGFSNGTVASAPTGTLAEVLWAEDHISAPAPLRNQTLIMTTGKLAELAHVSPRTAAEWCDANLVGSYRIPSSTKSGKGETRRVYVDSAVAFLRSRNMPLGEFGPVEHHACLMGDRCPIPSTHPFRVGYLARRGVLGNYLTGVGNDSFAAAIELARLVAEYSPTSMLGILLSDDISSGALPVDLFDVVFEHHEPAAGWLATQHPFRLRGKPRTANRKPGGGKPAPG